MAAWQVLVTFKSCEAVSENEEHGRHRTSTSHSPKMPHRAPVPTPLDKTASPGMGWSEGEAPGEVDVEEFGVGGKY